jgi:hypothetical protein
MFTTQQLLEPKVVLLLSGGRMPLDSSAAGWAFAVGAATSPSGERLFTSVHHLVPEHIASRDIPAAIKKQFAEELRSAGIPEEAVQPNLERMSFDTVPTLTVESLLRQIETLPARSAVTISCADAYQSLPPPRWHLNRPLKHGPVSTTGHIPEKPCSSRTLQPFSRAVSALPTEETSSSHSFTRIT